MKAESGLPGYKIGVEAVIRRRCVWLLLAFACVGCQAGAPTGNHGASKRPKTAATTGPGDRTSFGSTPNPALKPTVARLPLESLTRVLGTDTVAAKLTGKVKLISDAGAGIISNNTGNLIANNGGGLNGNNSAGMLANKGGNIIANNGGGFAADARRGLFQAARVREENLLGDAEIEFLDGGGAVVAGLDGKPIGAKTDAMGVYSFEGQLPNENLVARVRLWNGGILQALLPKATAGVARTLDLDTAATLGASFVLERFVQKRKDVYARLPTEEAEALYREVLAARAVLGDRVPSYKPTDLLAIADEVRGKNKAVESRLARIEAILLVGQANLGEGQDARTVSLAGPTGLAVDTAGNVYVSEAVGGRVRMVGTDGKIRRYAGGVNDRGLAPEDPAGLPIEGPADLALAADGTLYIADPFTQRVMAVKDGKGKVVVGTGKREQTMAAGKGVDFPMMGPNCLALASDGTVYIGENPKKGSIGGRILVYDPASGNVAQDTGPADKMGIAGLTFTPDGALWLLDASNTGNKHVWRKPKDGTWAVVLDQAGVNDYNRLVALPDNSVAYTNESNHRVERVTPTGVRSTIAGSVQGFFGDGGRADAARLNAPSGLSLNADGGLLIADKSNGVVRKVAPPLDGSGLISTVAGTFGVSQQGDALSIAINTPSGMVFDPQGRLVFSESASATVKRLDGSNLTLLAGTSTGRSGDGGPAIAAQFNAPSGIAYIGSDLYILELENPVIRKIDANGIVTRVVGTGNRGHFSEKKNALEADMRVPIACAVSPDARLYWVDTGNNQIARLNKDGTVEPIVIGADGDAGDSGDGGPARLAQMNKPLGLAFDSKGDLYVADAGNARIRRITKLDTSEPMIDTFAGKSLLETIVGVRAGGEQSGPIAASEALFIGPTGLIFDDQDRLYIAEMGSARLNTFFGNDSTLASFDLPKIGSAIRRVTGIREGSPMIEPLAGRGTRILNTPGSDDSLLVPSIILFDPAKGLYVLDTGNNQIKLVPKALL